MSDPTGSSPPPGVGEALDIRTLGRKARGHQISGHALASVAVGLAVFAAALLLWAGIVQGPIRVILLLLAAAVIPLRLLASRLSAVTVADGVEGGAVNSALRRWLSHWEAAGLLMAGGLCAFGSGHDMGAVLGAVCAALLLLAGLRGPVRGYWLGLYPTSVLAATALAAVFEPAWGWRGQTFLVGLNVIAVVLIVQVLRRRA